MPVLTSSFYGAAGFTERQGCFPRSRLGQHEVMPLVLISASSRLQKGKGGGGLPEARSQVSRHFSGTHTYTLAFESKPHFVISEVPEQSITNLSNKFSAAAVLPMTQPPVSGPCRFCGLSALPGSLWSPLCGKGQEPAATHPTSDRLAGLWLHCAQGRH